MSGLQYFDTKLSFRSTKLKNNLYLVLFLGNKQNAKK